MRGSKRHRRLSANRLQLSVYKSLEASQRLLIYHNLMTLTASQYFQQSLNINSFKGLDMNFSKFSYLIIKHG